MHPLNLGTDEEGVDVTQYALRFRDELLRRLGRKVRAVVVFGSRVTGRWKPWSDIDILVVVKRDRVSKHDLVVKHIPYAPLVDPWVYYDDELPEELRRFNIAILDALQHGIPLHDDGYWRELKREFERFKQEWELVEIPDGWVSRRLERPSGSRKASENYGSTR